MKFLEQISIMAAVLSGILLISCKQDASSSNTDAHTPSGSAPTPAYEFHSTVTYLPAGTDGILGEEVTYAYFGDWPQTVKKPTITVYETSSKTMGGATYYVGSDGNYYAKCIENAFSSGYTYSDGTAVAKASEKNVRYFKVEPIKWCVLTKNYGGNTLLIAEKILTANIAYYDYTVDRSIEDKTVSPNNYMHSKIRAYLNGLSYTKKADVASVQEEDASYKDNGFLQTAFTNDAQALIVAATLDNSAASTNPASNAALRNKGENSYACDNTSDRIFLLSEKEATTADYGFAEYNVYITKKTEANSRVRKVTDYAKANYAYESYTESIGGWWLRSPLCDSGSLAYYVYVTGNAYGRLPVNSTEGGVVPALLVPGQ